MDAIQGQWRQDLALPAGITLYAYLTEEYFVRSVYLPTLQHDARELMKQRVASASDLSTLGRDSYRDLITPGVAALLLILCGLAVQVPCAVLPVAPDEGTTAWPVPETAWGVRAAGQRVAGLPASLLCRRATCRSKARKPSA